MKRERKFTRHAFTFGKRQNNVKPNVMSLEQRISVIQDRETREYLILCKDLSENLCIWALIEHERGLDLRQIKARLENLVKEMTEEMWNARQSVKCLTCMDDPNQCVCEPEIDEVFLA